MRARSLSSKHAPSIPHELGTHLRRLRLRIGHHTHFNPWIVFVNRAPTCAAPASALICLRRPRLRISLQVTTLPSTHELGTHLCRPRLRIDLQVNHLHCVPQLAVDVVGWAGQRGLHGMKRSAVGGEKR